MAPQHPLFKYRLEHGLCLLSLGHHPALGQQVVSICFPGEIFGGAPGFPHFPSGQQIWDQGNTRKIKLIAPVAPRPPVAMGTAVPKVSC